MTLSPNERWLYFQVSFFHGFVEYDLKNFRVRRVINLPRTHSLGVPRQDYLLDSAHHGIAMNPRGTRICVAGTMDDYAAVVSRRTGLAKIMQFRDGAKPYWVTPSANGRYCYISLSGFDRVAVIDYRKRRVVKSFQVGDHPQRMRTGVIRRAFVR
jgi:DNA-binding beta-propeller fold protein YncE